MLMAPTLRKFALTIHIITSVGWFGAVLAFLVLAIVGVGSENLQTVRSVYIGMGLVAVFAILPLCILSFLSGLIQSLGTVWGLFRHYWILSKLFISFFASIGLIVHMKPILRLAEIARMGGLSATELISVRTQLIADAGAALFVLLVVVLLSIYKPEGRTKYGAKDKNVEALPTEPKVGIPSWVYLFGGTVFMLLFLLIIRHISIEGMHH